MGSGASKEGLEGEPLETVDVHTGGINCMSLSEDSSLLVTGSDDKTVRMWSTKTEPIEDLGVLDSNTKGIMDLGVLTGHTSFIQCAVVYDTYVITGSKDTTIKRWDMASADCEFTYEGHTGRINRLICTGEFIFSTSHDKTARAWLFDTEDVDDPADACIRVLEGHTSVVSPLIFIPGHDTGIPDENGLNINPGDLIVTASFDNTVKVWSFDTGACLKTLKGHRKPITCMDTDPKGRILYTAGQDRCIIAWDINMGKKMKVVEEAHTGAILYLRVVNRLMYTSGTDHTAKCWVREGLENTRIYKDHTDSVACAKFHNGILYTVCNDGFVRAFDAKSGALKRKYKGHENAVTCLTVCVNEYEGEVYTRLMTGGNDSTVRVWNATDLSDKIPLIQQPVDRDYTRVQSKRLDELNQHLDDYMPDDSLNKSSGQTVPGGIKNNLDDSDLNIIDAD